MCVQRRLVSGRGGWVGGVAARCGIRDIALISLLYNLCLIDSDDNSKDYAILTYTHITVDINPCVLYTFHFYNNIAII